MRISIEHIVHSRDYSDQGASAFRLNDKLTDIQAALAITQVQKLDELLRRRQALAQQYDSLLASLVETDLIVLPLDTPGRIWYRYPIRLKQHFARTISERMRALGVSAELPVHDSGALQTCAGKLPAATEAFDRAPVSFPLYPRPQRTGTNVVASSSLCVRLGIVEASPSKPAGPEPRACADGILDEFRSFYDRLVETHGHEPRACDYGRPESQIAKLPRSRRCCSSRR